MRAQLAEGSAARNLNDTHPFNGCRFDEATMELLYAFSLRGNFAFRPSRKNVYNARSCAAQATRLPISCEMKLISPCDLLLL